MENELEIAKRFVEWLSSGKIFPYLLEIRLTDRCNLKCLTCWQRAWDGIDRDFKEISIETWMRVIKEAKKMGVVGIEITGGGEPLIRLEECVKIMKLVKELNMKGSLVTNGTLFTESSLKEIVKMGWDKIHFSIDGHTPEINDFLRGVNGAFEKAVEAIRKLNFWKKKLGKDAPRIVLMPVVTNVNYDKLDGLLELAHQLEVPEVIFQGMVVHSDIGKKLELTEKQKEELLSRIPSFMEKAKELGIKTNLESFLPYTPTPNDKGSRSPSSVIKLPLCILPWYYVGIRADGSVKPCPIDSPDRDWPSIINSSLEEIIYGEVFQEIRKMLIEQKVPSSCSHCCPNVIGRNNKIKKGVEKYIKLILENFGKIENFVRRGDFESINLIFQRIEREM